MKIAFVSNYYNHHQSALSHALWNLTEGQFVFIETEPMEAERIKGGWAVQDSPSFVRRSYEGLQDGIDCQAFIDNADVVIWGSAPFSMLRNRHKANKLTFVYSERMYRSGYEAWKLPVRMVRFWKKYGQYKNTQLLCSSAFTSADFAKTRTFINKAYRWGYFPACRLYDNPESLYESKRSASILWVARLMELKHPEAPIEVAQRLKSDGVEFHLTMVGTGALEGSVKTMIRDADLDDVITLIPSLTAEQVRDLMEKCQIFLFTSDFNEGWGAVLNESMNSACAAVASHAIGSVPFLLEHEKNGLVFENENWDDLYEKVKALLLDDGLRKSLSLGAYRTIAQEWNADVAAERLIGLSIQLLSGTYRAPFESGPVSAAPILKNDWFNAS